MQEGEMGNLRTTFLDVTTFSCMALHWLEISGKVASCKGFYSPILNEPENDNPLPNLAPTILFQI